MDQMNWKTWTAAAALIIALFAIYVFASPEPPSEEDVTATAAPVRANSRDMMNSPGVEPVRLDLLEPDTGSYRSERNLFAYREPPPPPPPVVFTPKPPPPPPDKDKDGIPDFRDNCAAKANPDQTDIDGDGIGAACETDVEIAPPPPPPPAPVPPQFTWKFIGTFGPPARPIATFAREGDIVNARVGDIIEGKFMLRSIGIESAEISFIGFPPETRQRIPIGQ